MTLSWSRRDTFAVLTIVVCTVLCYSNSFECPFLFDDLGAIVFNESIRDLTKIWTVLTQRTQGTVAGRPLLNLTLALNYAFAGTKNVWDYHAFNLSLHCAAAIVLFGLVKQTLLLPRIPERLRRDAVSLSFATTLIWAIHPLQTESVTYLIQRAESLVAFFYLLTLYCVLRSSTSKHPLFWQLSAVTACLLGMSSKEVMVTAPVVVFLFDRVFLADSWKESITKRWGLHLALCGTWAWLAMLVWSSRNRNDSAGFGLGISAWDYAMTQFGFIVRYLKLVFVPFPLVFDYGDPIARQPAEIIPYALIVFLLLCGTGLLLYFRPTMGFLGICFFLILAPTSTIVPIVTQTAAEHRMYLPLAPIVALCVISVHQFLERISHSVNSSASGKSWGSILVRSILFSIIAVALGYLTYQRNEDYRSEFVLWEKTARDFPSNIRAFHKVGAEYLKRGQATEAIESFTRMITIRPEMTVGYLSRADAYAVSQQYDLAIQDYQHVTQMKQADPSVRAQTYVQLGSVYYLLGRLQAAIESFNHAIESEPDQVTARSLREQLLRRVGTTTTEPAPKSPSP